MDTKSATIICLIATAYALLVAIITWKYISLISYIHIAIAGFLIFIVVGSFIDLIKERNVPKYTVVDVKCPLHGEEFHPILKTRNKKDKTIYKKYLGWIEKYGCINALVMKRVSEGFFDNNETYIGMKELEKMHGEKFWEAFESAVRALSFMFLSGRYRDYNQKLREDLINRDIENFIRHTVEVWMEVLGS